MVSIYFVKWELGKVSENQFSGQPMQCEGDCVVSYVSDD